MHSIHPANHSCDIDFSDSKRSKASLVYYVYGTVRGQQVHYMASTLRDFRTLTEIWAGKKH